MKELDLETRICVGDLQDIIAELLEIIAPGKLDSQFFKSLKACLDKENTIYSTDDFRKHLTGRVKTFLEEIESDKRERKLRIVL